MNYFETIQVVAVGDWFVNLAPDFQPFKDKTKTTSNFPAPK